MRNYWLFFLLLASPYLSSSQDNFPNLLSERDRGRVVDEILEDRLDNLLPELMRREGVDMWILISREYNEDPVMKTMLPSTWLSARRRTIMVFYDQGGEEGLDKIAIARYNVGKLLKGEWNLDVYPNQWEALVNIIKEKNPQKIGLNYSKDFALADGLVKTEYQEFLENLPESYHDRVVSAERLAIAWLETRSAKELEIYPMICHMGHQILQAGLSEEVIHPGLTTTDDVVWALRQKVRDLGLDTWFHPSVSVQRSDMGNNEFLRSFSRRPEKDVIQAGDLLHVDFGITYLRLNTDQQQHFYVLRPGETEVPKGIQKAFKNGNRLQDILTEQFKTGKTGNEILADALAQAKSEGITGSIYTHPIGSHGHAAGPTIGMWDQQGGVKGKGDYPLFPNTAYSIELFAATEVPEWGKLVRIMLEEDGVFYGEKFEYLDGRMTEILTIPRK
ncbi:aminopeptidase P family protein [Saprospiraceae bacterium]|jgi:Xaa-Pro aminopeptidase|nr:aminopeptidase P family protein [Bacteroidota bacterium]MDB4727192.1 aminopeptidase P family protein [Saprospiraceae bacterium]MDF1866570.1 M24 family metallopeptidase [Saprospiraceae bacterium]